MRLTPLYIFDDPAEFYDRHSKGVLREFQNESKEVNQFNDRETQFKAWILAKLYRGKANSYWVFLIRPTEQTDHFFPREGESCEITLWQRSGKAKRWEKSWDAERIENPAATFGIPEGPAHRLPAFKVKVPNNVPEDVLRAMEDDPDQVGYDAPSRLTGRYAFSDKKAYRVTMVLRMSSATKDAEIGALDKLYKNPDDVLTDKQIAAFKYLMNFKDVPFTVNMFHHFPHLRDPINNPSMPPRVITMLKGFNEHQRTAYKVALSRIPCGVCILPGGPGAGKTHWNLVLTAAIQSKNIIYHGPDTFENRSAKVLYILDINKPLDDTCNKIVKLYKRLGLNKHAVRLHGWHYGHDPEVPDFSSKFMLMARMNRYRRQTANEGCLAPSLDELVWDFYESKKTSQYRELHEILNRSANGDKAGDSGKMKVLVRRLYQDVLARVDFIATTPVPAATGFHGLFKPDIVIFDESPHAREASTTVSVAHYSPIAWIFSGDHRQTRPFVASDDVRDNEWAPQMLVSMMERADRAGVIKTSLLINHRGYGGLQKLASEMFYAKKMISGHTDEELFPPTVRHLQRYLERFLPDGQKCREPRIIAFNGKRGELRVGTSWYNESHITWVMERVRELLPDPMFRQVDKNERGTILIISPYKESYMKYKRAIKELPATWQARLNVEGRVEARTIDTVQGGEADFVFLDMVRSESTDFTDDPNRLNVAITRARQAEIIMMHPGMRRGARYLAGIFHHCDGIGQVVDISVDGQPKKKLDQEPDEERAYDEHVRQQRQLDQQRVSHGLEPVAAETPSRDADPVAIEDPAVLTDEDDGPQSIYTEKFADLGLADFMQSILNENKAERDAEKRTRTQAQTQAQLPSNGAAHTQGGPLQIDRQTDSESISHVSACSQGQPPSGPSHSGSVIPRQGFVRNDTGGASGRKLSSVSRSSEIMSRIDANKAPTTSPGKAGLSQSRWNTGPVESGQGAFGVAQDAEKAVGKENQSFEQPLKQLLPSGSDWW